VIHRFLLKVLGRAQREGELPRWHDHTTVVHFVKETCRLVVITCMYPILIASTIRDCPGETDPQVLLPRVPLSALWPTVQRHGQLWCARLTNALLGCCPTVAHVRGELWPYHMTPCG